MLRATRHLSWALSDRPSHSPRRQGAGVAQQGADQDHRAVFGRERDRHRRADRVRAGRQPDRPDFRGREPRRRRHDPRLRHGGEGGARRLHAAGQFDLARRRGVDLRASALQRRRRLRRHIGAGRYPIRHRDCDQIQHAQRLIRQARSRAAMCSTAPPASALPGNCSWSACASPEASRPPTCRFAAPPKG